jgi:alpha-tubulin suppressor-like RCC1 family protein/ABC-type transport system involved in multi-copper enzyme maturation permease subunit
MRTLLRKEIRLIFPAWIVAMLLAILPVWLLWPPYSYGVYYGPGFAYYSHGSYLPVPGPIVFIPFALGALLLGITSLGQEFNLKTFSLLLAQPVPRRRLWALKTRVLAAALALAFIALCVSNVVRVDAVIDTMKATVWRNAFHTAGGQAQMLKVIRGTWWMAFEGALTAGGLAILAAFAGGLWTTLLFRQISAALWFTVLIPSALGLFTARLLQSFADGVIVAGMFAVLGLYTVAGYLWARNHFLQAQDVQWTGGSISFPARRSATRSSAAGRRKPPLRALAANALQTHLVALGLAGALLVLHLVVLFVRKMEFDPAHPTRGLYQVLSFWWLLWLALPLLIGSAAVAEERKQGTLESLLCLPVSRRLQWVVKFVPALLLGVLLGGVMPWALERIGLALGTIDSSLFWKMASTTHYHSVAEYYSAVLMATCAAAAGLTIVSFYASTLTRNLLQALGAAVALALGFTAFGVWAVVKETQVSPVLWGTQLLVYIGLPIVLGTVGWLAYSNFQRLQTGWRLWRRNLFALAVSLACVTSATALVWNRAWERVMPLEAAHGPARLRGPVRPIICSIGGRPLVLLPDGRLWAPNEMVLKESNWYDRVVDENGMVVVRNINRPIPTGGTFLGGSNWVDLASFLYGSREAAGVRSDGSLWSIAYPDLTNYGSAPTVERIGTDSDWKWVAAGSGYFLAVKRDGTLWGWGRNNNGQLGPGPKFFANGPERIGHDSDWTAVFASGATSVAVKRDGSVWKWGYLDYSPTGYERNWVQNHPEPVRWHLDGGDWRSFVGSARRDLFVRQDGTLWASGMLTENLLGHDLLEAGRGFRFTAQPMRIGGKSDWSEVTANWNDLAALNTSGQLFQSYTHDSLLFFWGNVWNPSRYSDWIAIHNDRGTLIALAADGTLCAWEYPEQRVNGRSLLGPSRKPWWTVKIPAEPQ